MVERPAPDRLAGVRIPLAPFTKKKMVKKVKEKKVRGKAEFTLLLENFALIQKTLVDLTMSLNELKEKFEQFLNLIEKTAEKMEKEKEVKKIVGEVGVGVPSELVKKIDLLIEQNKTIAEGIMLLEKFIKERIERGGLSI